MPIYETHKWLFPTRNLLFCQHHFLHKTQQKSLKVSFWLTEAVVATARMMSSEMCLSKETSGSHPLNCTPKNRNIGIWRGTTSVRRVGLAFSARFGSTPPRRKWWSHVPTAPSSVAQPRAQCRNLDLLVHKKRGGKYARFIPTIKTSKGYRKSCVQHEGVLKPFCSLLRPSFRPSF